MENEFGALSRVVGLFSQRGYNINALSVSQTNNIEISRLTLITSGSPSVISQIKKQLEKLLNVIDVVDITSLDHTEKQLSLVKLKAADISGIKLASVIANFNASIVKSNEKTGYIILQLSSTNSEISSCIDYIGKEHVLEVVSSGVIGIENSIRHLKE